MPCGRTDGRTEMERLVVAFPEFCTRRTAHSGHVVQAAEGRYTAMRVQYQYLSASHTLQ